VHALTKRSGIGKEGGGSSPGGNKGLDRAGLFLNRQEASADPWVAQYDAPISEIIRQPSCMQRLCDYFNTVGAVEWHDFPQHRTQHEHNNWVDLMTKETENVSVALSYT